MKRNEIINRLIQEGISERTLVNFTDKQLNDLSERMLGEQQTSQTQGKGMLNVKNGSPDEAAAKQAEVTAQTESVTSDEQQQKA